MNIETVNPATGCILKAYPIFNEEQVTACINSADVCQRDWRKRSFEERKIPMKKLAHLLRKKKEELAVLMAQEMGKPILQGRGEIEKCALACEHYAKNAENYLASRLIKTEMRKTKVCHLPLGVIFVIMPWNFPFWQVFRCAVPAVMAGNAVLLKHAPISTGSGNRITQLFIEAGFPENLFQHLQLNNQLAAKVIAHEKVVGVSLTGSEKAGSVVGALAASHHKKIVLELGGNDPYLVLADADLDLAVSCIVASRMNNSGQVCIAAKRTIVVKTCLDALIEKILNQLKKYVMGDPVDLATNFGPMARLDLRDLLHNQVTQSIQHGAHLLTGGKIPPGNGFYYPPTLLKNVRPGMPAFDDELFGPVVAIIAADDENHAISLANKSRFGLGAAVFTCDIERGEKIATEEIDAGSCFVNALVSSDPRVPFGGIKHSGFGRELSREGILEFVNIKTVSIQ